MTEIKHCPTCKEHEFQDKKYGNKMRVHNSLSVAKGKQEYKCTVCEKVQ